MKLKTILSIFFFIGCSISYGQSTKIYILDKEGNTPLPGAHATITNLSKPTTILSTQEGTVHIPNMYFQEDTTLKIRITYLGYKPRTISIALGQEKTVLLLTDEQTMNQVVITGQYSPNNPEKSVHRVTIIDQKKISSMGAVNLEDVLSNEMSIRLSRDNILGSSMSLQGISGQNVKIMIDGVPIIGRQNGNIDLSQINLDQVERIEIIEGPMSVNYGTNALGGVINLIMKKNQKQTLSSHIRGYYESIGNMNLTGGAGFQKDGWGLALDAGRNYFDGWNPEDKAFERPDYIADTTRFSQWKPKTQLFGGARISYQRKKWNIQLSSRIFEENIINKGLPRAPYYITAFDDNYYTMRFDNAIRAQGKVGRNGQFKAMASFNDYLRRKNSYAVDLTGVSKELATTSGDQDTSTFQQLISRSSYVYQPDSSWYGFEIGYDINVQFAQGARIDSGVQSLGDYALFSTLEVRPIDGLIIKPGFRVAHNSEYKAPFLPSVNLRYKLSKFTLRLAYARGFRAPSLKELYFDFVDINHNISGAQDLTAERSNSYNAAITHTTLIKKALYKIELSAYRNDISDMITLAQVPNATSYSYANIGAFKTQGARIEGQIAIGHLKVSVGVSEIGRLNTLAETDPSLNTFIYSPEVRSNIRYTFQPIGLTASVFYKYTGNTPQFILASDNSIQQSEIQGFQMADASLQRKFWNNRLELTFGVKNIFDITNINSISSGGTHSSGGFQSISTGRSYFGSLKIQLATKEKNAKKK